MFVDADATLQYVAQIQKGRVLTKRELKWVRGQNVSLNVVEVDD